MERMIHIAGSMSPSGIGNYIMNVYRHIDRTRVQFDFILCEKREVSFDEEIESMGGRIFYITRKSVSPIRNFLETLSIIRKHHYKTVFRHTDISTVALDLMACALGGAKNRIPHSHSTSTGNKRAHRLFMPLLNGVSTRRFACSEAAGRWLYGNDKPFEVIINAIDLEDFDYDAIRRESVRKELCISGDTLVLGHVGNLLPVKNHLFLLEAIKELVKITPDIKLLLVGDGEMRGQIEDKVRALRLEKHVILLGVREDIPDLLMAFDIFCFPSKYEGLPIALVEAQRAGLPCIISDNINNDCDVISDLIKRLPIDSGSDTSGEKTTLTKSSGLKHSLDECSNNKDPVPKPSLPEPALIWARAAAALKGASRIGTDTALFTQKGFNINEMVKIYENIS